MNHEEGFLQAIRAAPGDNTPRLVYADWLEERGDRARANYLRLECAWVPQPAADDPQCNWRYRNWSEVSPTEAVYPSVLRRLSEVARDIEPAWLARTSRVGQEIGALVDRFTAHGCLRPFAEPRPESRTATDRWWRAMADVRQMFEKHLGQSITQARFTVPVDYTIFVSLVTNGLIAPDGHPLLPEVDCLFDAAGMARLTIEECDMYAKDFHDVKELLAQCGLWLSIGGWNKHYFYLCCDLALPAFGMVVDMHDSHPWISPQHGGPSPWEVVTRSFLDFLRFQAALGQRIMARRSQRMQQ